MLIGLYLIYCAQLIYCAEEGHVEAIVLRDQPAEAGAHQQVHATEPGHRLLASQPGLRGQQVPQRGPDRGPAAGRADHGGNLPAVLPGQARPGHARRLPGSRLLPGQAGHLPRYHTGPQRALPQVTPSAAPAPAEFLIVYGGQDPPIVINIMASQQSSGLNWLVTYNPIAWAVQSIFKSNIASRLADYFHGLLFKTHSPRAQKFLFTVGVAAITYRSLAFLYRQYSAWKWVPAHLRNRQRVCQSRLKEAYGDCYAVVTGCTEGIGLAFVHEFARMNIGVVLVARNKDKLLKRIEEVRYLHPGFRYEVVIGDLGDPHHIANVAAQLVELSKKVDIGIIVNNAGFVSAKFKNYIQQDIKELKDVMTINFVSVYQINAVMLPVMRARKHRSAILNLSSCTGVMLSQGNGLYSVSKKMLDVYTRTLALENRDKLDVLSVRPFGVSTPMMANKKGKFMITARDCAVSSLADLGVQDTTWTGFMHKVQAAYLEQLNETQIFNIYDQLFAKFK